MHAIFSQPQFPALLDEVKEWPGVEAIELALEAPVTLSRKLRPRMPS